MNFVFDVDGTLTPSRGVMDLEFKTWFLKFASKHPVHLVTGSDFEKTLEQVGEDVINAVQHSFNCAGNAVYVKGNCVYQTDWVLPNEAHEFLAQHLLETPYLYKYGKHFEQRIGLLNFSVVGRNAVGCQRTDYYEWDKQSGERQYLVNEINTRWPELQAAAGGETGIDIFPQGCDKAQILSKLSGDVSFFGDRIDPAGNDWSIAQSIIDQKRGRCYNVNDWTDTFNILKELFPYETAE